MRTAIVAACLLLASVAHADTPAEIYDRVANATDQQKAAVRALDDLAAYVQAHPDDAQGPFVRAQIESFLGKKEDAIASYEAALALDPQTPDADYDVAVLLLGLERDDAAIAHLRAAVALNPKDADAYYNLGQVQYNHGRFADALAAWKASLAITPASFEAAKKVVQAHNGLGHDADALKARAAAIALWRASTDPAVQKLTEYVIDQLDVAGWHVYAYETLPDQDPTVIYRFALVGADGKTAASLEVEKQGKRYALVKRTPDGASTTMKAKLGKKLGGWKKLRATVVKAIKKEVGARP